MEKYVSITDYCRILPPQSKTSCLIKSVESRYETHLNVSFGSLGYQSSEPGKERFTLPPESEIRK
ncbi:hypothetical protein BH09CHL1_BH09CHL1_09270 [soil metagenome]